MTSASPINFGVLAAVTAAATVGYIAGRGRRQQQQRSPPPPSSSSSSSSDNEEERQFRHDAAHIVDWIITYRRGLCAANTTTVIRSSVKPGYLLDMLPKQAPTNGEPFDAVFGDFERCVMPGITHWQSSRFFAYFKPHASYPAILGELLASGLNVMGFSWIASPAVTELETVVLNWLGRMLQLPPSFLCESASSCKAWGGDDEHDGGGVIQGSAGESAIVCMLAAKMRALDGLSGDERALRASRLRILVSEHTHCTIDKACRVLDIDRAHIEVVQATNMHGLCVNDVQQALIGIDEQDIPFFVCLTYGTTSSGAIDDIDGITAWLRSAYPEDRVWIHIDGAWGGAFAALPEYRARMNGIERADSLVVNAHKQLLVPFDCCCLWLRHRKWVLAALTLDPNLEEYLRNARSDNQEVIDYKDWQLPLGRRFRALKLYFTLRSYGVSGIQGHLRRGVELAERFRDYLDQHSDQFTCVCVSFSLVVFRANGSNEDNQRLLDAVNESGQVFLIHTSLDNQVVLRLACGGIDQAPRDIDAAWQIIHAQWQQLLCN